MGTFHKFFIFVVNFNLQNFRLCPAYPLTFFVSDTGQFRFLVLYHIILYPVPHMTYLNLTTAMQGQRLVFIALMILLENISCSQFLPPPVRRSVKGSSDTVCTNTVIWRRPDGDESCHPGGGT